MFVSVYIITLVSAISQICFSYGLNLIVLSIIAYTASPKTFFLVEIGHWHYIRKVLTGRMGKPIAHLALVITALAFLLAANLQSTLITGLAESKLGLIPVLTESVTQDAFTLRTPVLVGNLAINLSSVVLLDTGNKVFTAATPLTDIKPYTLRTESSMTVGDIGVSDAVSGLGLQCEGSGWCYGNQQLGAAVPVVMNALTNLFVSNGTRKTKISSGLAVAERDYLRFIAMGSAAVRTRIVTTVAAGGAVTYIEEVSRHVTVETTADIFSDFFKELNWKGANTSYNTVAKTVRYPNQIKTALCSRGRMLGSDYSACKLHTISAYTRSGARLPSIDYLRECIALHDEKMNCVKERGEALALRSDYQYLIDPIRQYSRASLENMTVTMPGGMGLTLEYDTLLGTGSVSGSTALIDVQYPLWTVMIGLGVGVLTLVVGLTLKMLPLMKYYSRGVVANLHASWFDETGKCFRGDIDVEPEIVVTDSDNHVHFLIDGKSPHSVEGLKTDIRKASKDKLNVLRGRRKKASCVAEGDNLSLLPYVLSKAEASNELCPSKSLDATVFQVAITRSLHAGQYDMLAFAQVEKLSAKSFQKKCFCDELIGLGAKISCNEGNGGNETHRGTASRQDTTTSAKGQCEQDSSEVLSGKGDHISVCNDWASRAEGKQLVELKIKLVDGSVPDRYVIRVNFDDPENLGDLIIDAHDIDVKPRIGSQYRVLIADSYCCRLTEDGSEVLYAIMEVNTRSRNAWPNVVSRCINHLYEQGSLPPKYSKSEPCVEIFKKMHQCYGSICEPDTLTVDEYEGSSDDLDCVEQEQIGEFGLGDSKEEFTNGRAEGALSVEATEAFNRLGDLAVDLKFEGEVDALMASISSINSLGVYRAKVSRPALSSMCDSINVLETTVSMPVENRNLESECTNTVTERVMDPTPITSNSHRLGGDDYLLSTFSSGLLRCGESGDNHESPNGLPNENMEIPFAGLVTLITIESGRDDNIFDESPAGPHSRCEITEEPLGDSAKVVESSPSVMYAYSENTKLFHVRHGEVNARQMAELSHVSSRWTGWRRIRAMSNCNRQHVITCSWRNTSLRKSAYKQYFRRSCSRKETDNGRVIIANLVAIIAVKFAYIDPPWVWKPAEEVFVEVLKPPDRSRLSNARLIHVSHIVGSDVFNHSQSASPRDIKRRNGHTSSVFSADTRCGR